ncbi:SBBP repeat-containing protein [Hymenobacter sp. BT635]|uniref:SBBP repeat-containing protein n=1 Tax=Hymenobacter nitidus TaxID=2880929 RepID=A0ABS8AIH8_9BACT|nr:SBBP repeat-containing protein [Hymenobacter nitidus]MCB2378804.1 SBBP repeat-containing protein [Hymenobacter nitidus]
MFISLPSLPRPLGVWLTCMLLLLSAGSFAQTWEMAQSLGTSAYNGQASARHTVADGAGNLYISGIIDGEISLGGRTLSSPSSEPSGFIAKINASTGQCQWAFVTPATVLDLALDASGNLLTAGYFTGRSLTLGATTLTNNVPNFYGSDLFVAKISAAGQWQWAYQASGPGSKQATSIAFDASGNAYVAGTFGGGSATFGTTTLTAAGNGVFVAKLSATGQWQWATNAGSDNANSAADLALDASGNAYLTGYFSGVSATFGSFTLNNTYPVAGSGLTDAYVAKLSPAGQWLWASKSEGQNSEEPSSLALDAGGNVYVAGGFRGFSAGFGTTRLTNSGSTDVFVAKLSTSGQWLWATQATGAVNEDFASLAVDAAGNAYLTGSTNSPRTTFGGIILTNTFRDNYASAVYAAKLNSSGQWQWVAQSSGQSAVYPGTLTLDASNNIFLAGFYQTGNLTFGSTTLRNSGVSDLYVARLTTAGQWQWAMNSDGGSRSSVSNVAVDAAGNVYSIGIFSGSLTLGSTTLVGNNNNDLFVAKRSPAGQWLWVAQPAGTARFGGGYFESKPSLALDAAGNVYITGCFNGADATFGTNVLSSTAGGYLGYDTFVAKLSTSGQWQWATAGGGDGDDYGSSIAVDASANAYVAGSFQSSTLGLGATTLTNSGSLGSSEIFAAKLSANGQWQWAARAGGTGDEQGSDLALDAAGNAYVAGNFSGGNAAFGSTTLTTPGYNAYVAKLSSTGQWQWATAGGSGYAGASAIAADATGNTYVTGFFGGPGSFGSLTLNSTDSSDVFVGKVTPAGQWQWVAQGGLRGSNSAYDVAVDGTGSAYVTGSFRSAGAIFGTTTLPYSRRSYYDTFVASLTPTGQWQWATKSAGTNFTHTLALGGGGSIYVGGEFSGPYGDIRATFGPHTLTTTGRVHQIGYLARLSFVITANQLPSKTLAMAQAVPNPFAAALSLHLLSAQPGLVELTAHDATGRQWLRKQVTVQANQGSLELPEAAQWPAGLYLLTVRQGQQQQVLKVVRQ